MKYWTCCNDCIHYLLRDEVKGKINMAMMKSDEKEYVIRNGSREKFS